MTTPVAATAEKFPKVFWTANVTELFERAAFYSIASFVVIYLEELGFGKYWPSTLNGLLWTIVYLLPVVSGTIADQIGYRRALLIAFVLLSAGYFLLGSPVWLGGATLSVEAGGSVTAGPAVAVPILAGLLLVGIGGSFVKPCILGTAQRSAGSRATLAFAIFYMVVNIGSIVGRIVAFVVRRGKPLSLIFAVATTCALIAFFVVLSVYRDPKPSVAADVAPKPKRSVKRILLDMVLVLRSGRFALFLLVSSGFYFLYNQVYNVLPLYVKNVVELKPAMELYTAANPVMIVCFQLLVTKFFGKMRPIRSIIVGIVIISASMALNLVPLYSAGGVRAMTAVGIPMASLFIVLTVAAIAFGELFTSARTFEYIGGLAPKGQEGLFLGYANLPMAIGSFVGGPVGAVIFNDVMSRNAKPVVVTAADGTVGRLLELDPTAAAQGWGLLMAIGVASVLAMWWFNRWLERQEKVAA
jgi:POT family proton-dependent oligopeptide transporter